VGHPGCVCLPDPMLRRLVGTVAARLPLKSFGFLVSDGPTRRPVDFVLFEQNLRNGERWRGEFEAYGKYFVEHDDAGFVAEPAESLRLQRLLMATGMSEVAVFHSHRRHPGSFSRIDYEMHRSRFGGLWHLIISMRNPLIPQVRAFAPGPAGVDELEVRVTDDPR